MFNCDARVIVVTSPGSGAGTTASVSAFDCASLELTLLSVISVVFVSGSGKAESGKFNAGDDAGTTASGIVVTPARSIVTVTAGDIAGVTPSVCAGPWTP